MTLSFPDDTLTDLRNVRGRLGITTRHSRQATASSLRRRSGGSAGRSPTSGKLCTVSTPHLHTHYMYGRMLPQVLAELPRQNPDSARSRNTSGSCGSRQR